MDQRRHLRFALTPVLVHEYRRASLALQEFYAVAAWLAGGHSDIEVRLAAYDSYGRFVHHLYEFYKGCFETDGPKSRVIRGARLDPLLQRETSKLMGDRADRIARGDGEARDNTESYYRQPVPEGFAASFREVRNQVAHASIERSRPSKGRVSLPEFFVRFHRFVILLYEDPYWIWQTHELSSIDWEEIGKFEDAIKLAAVHEDTPPRA
jgi:hypothetical protein